MLCGRMRSRGVRRIHARPAWVSAYSNPGARALGGSRGGRDAAGHDDDSAADRLDLYGLVARPRLVRRLLAARGTPRLAVLVAPAGYGKTTLLREWADADSRPLHLGLAGGRDPGPASLMRAIEAGLAQHDGGIVLVIDDAHLLRGRSTLAALAGLIDQLGEGSQLVLAARAEPALPLGRLRARRMLTELRTADPRNDPDRGHGSAGGARRGARPGRGRAAHVPDGGLARRAVSRGARLRRRDRQRRRGWPTSAATTASWPTTWRTRSSRRCPLSWPAFSRARRCSTGCRVRSATTCLARSGSARLLKQLSRMNLMLVPLDRSDDEYRYHRLFRGGVALRAAALGAGEGGCTPHPRERLVRLPRR